MINAPGLYMIAFGEATMGSAIFGIIWTVVVVRSVYLAASLASSVRLPMQWSMSGKPTWSASPAIAFGMIPFISLFVFASFRYTGWRASSDTPGRYVLLALATLAFHFIYSHFVKRYV